MSDEFLTTGILGRFEAEGTEPRCDDFIAECIVMTAAAHPDLRSDSSLMVQSAVSLAVQRLVHWAWRHREDDAAVPAQAVVGAFTAIGIAAVMLGYDLEDVIAKGAGAMRSAHRDAEQMKRDQANPQ